VIDQADIIDAYYFRHACKIFDADKMISDQDFATILETGRLSPSSFGYEPWRFLVVQDRALRDKLKPAVWGAQGTLPTASHFLVLLARKTRDLRYDSAYIDHMMRDVHHLADEAIEQRRGYYQGFQERDFKLLDSERAMFDWAARQVYIALGNMMTSAAMLGIDSCPIEGFVAAEVEPIMSTDFGIDSTEFGVAGMVAFGYRVDEPREKTRQAIDDMTVWYR
jgi:nitroreductase